MKTSRIGPEFRLILILFVSSRLMFLTAFAPEAITAYGDYEHYFNLARLSDRGLLPFLNYWYEFPPLFPYLSIGIYRLAAATTGAFHSYVYALSLLMMAFDAGNLVLLHRIAVRLWGERTAARLGWVYLVLPVGLVYTWRTFDSMSAFWLLLALCWLLENKEKRSAVVLGLGVLTKVLPGLLLPAVWAFPPPAGRLRYTLVVLVTVLLILGPFLVASPSFTIASLKAQAAKSSWQTVWALIDGNSGTGNVGPDIDHLDPAMATRLQGLPARLPPSLTFIPFAVIGFAFWCRARRQQPAGSNASRALVRLVALTLTLFLLWSKGWSPQWQMLLFPLVFLALPGDGGVLWCVLCGVISFLEWPVLLSRGLTDWLWLTVSVRTVLLVGLAAALGRTWVAGPMAQDGS